jgi:hypothetical protein
MHGHIEIWKMILETEAELRATRLRRHPYQALDFEINLVTTLRRWLGRFRRPGVAGSAPGAARPRPRFSCPEPVRRPFPACSCTDERGRRRRFGSCTARFAFRDRRPARCE